MRFVAIDQVIPGLRLAKTLYGAKGEILLRENFELTEGNLFRLIELGFTGLYIEDEISEGILIEDVVEEQVRLVAAARLEMIINKNGNIADMQPMISEIVDSIIANSDVVINMNKLRGHHEYTYLHCVNVGILAVSIGVKLKFKRERLIHLGTAGMLHDIGKKYIPEEILDKKGKLTDEEYKIIQQHPETGYKMLTDTRELSSISKVGVLQHHERYDGSGYPKGLKGCKITIFGRIIAVVDTYDAMTSDRAYRIAYSPAETMEYLMGAGNQLYDLQVIEKFTRCIAVYPVGTCAELSDGTKVIILQNYPDCVLRPLVRNIENKVIIDLKNDVNYLNICISKAIK